MKTIEEIFNEYLEKFCKKHKVTNEFYYTKPDYSEVSINNEYHNTLDIIYDIDHNISNDIYWKWKADYKKWWNLNRICCKTYSDYCSNIDVKLSSNFKLQKFFSIYNKYYSRASYNDMVGLPYNESDIVKQLIENSGYTDYTFEDFKKDYKIVNFREWGK